MSRAKDIVVLTTYVVIAVIWIYAIYDVRPARPGWAWAAGIAALALVTFSAGVALGRRSLLCLLLLVLCAIPAGTFAGDTEDRIPVVVVALVLLVPLSLVVLLAGAALRAFKRDSRQRPA
jgi:hypothetical protein